MNKIKPICVTLKEQHILEHTLAMVAFLSSNWNPTSNTVFSRNGNTSHTLLLLLLLLVHLQLHLLHVLGQRTFYVSTRSSRLSLESQNLFSFLGDHVFLSH
jgi:hypothetical protein